MRKPPEGLHFHDITQSPETALIPQTQLLRPEPIVNEENLSKEQRILRVLRKVLANIVKDATPAPGQPHPLKESTIYDIRDLFGLISEREAELADLSKPDRNEKPVFTDEPKKSNVIKMHPSGTNKPGDK
jgi:hypothetical protein